MAAASPNMGLREWPSLSDNFSFSDLDFNWGKVDTHDHSPGSGVPLPTGAFPDGTFLAAKFASRGLTPASFVGTAFTAATFMSDNLGRTRWFHRALATFDGGLNASGASTFAFRGTYGVPSNGGVAGGIFPINTADWAVAGKTTELVLRTGILTNNTPLGGNLNIGIVPVTGFAGASANGSNITFGAMVGPGTGYTLPTAQMIASSTASSTMLATGTYAVAGSTTVAVPINTVIQVKIGRAHV